MAKVDFTETSVSGDLNFDTFGCNVYDGSPSTPDRRRPDRRFERQGAKGIKVNMGRGEELEFWTFKDRKSGRTTFPAPMMRATAGEIIHINLKANKNTHTIHMHGIEPTPFNDGVGHTSFEVGGEYTYQFQANRPGTYFYHCHKNTVLHFEMGMYGLLIIDPSGGPGRLFEEGPAYDVEAFWVVDDVDPRYRGINHSAGLCGEDAQLNIFKPKHFMVTGIPSRRTKRNRKVKISARVGQTILSRFVNASYSRVRTTVYGLTTEIVGIDSRELGGRHRPWCSPMLLEPGESFDTVTAQRRDLIFRPTEPGRYKVVFEYRDWITGEIQDGGRGIAETVIEVTP